MKGVKVEDVVVKVGDLAAMLKFFAKVRHEKTSTVTLGSAELAAIVDGFAENRELRRRIAKVRRAVQKHWLHMAHHVECALRDALAAPRRKK